MRLIVRSVLPSGYFLSPWHAGWRGAGAIDPPVLFSLYVNDMPVPYHHFELALYADNTAVIVTSRKPALLVCYLEAYLAELERWLSKWRIAINVPNSTAMVFTRRRIQYPRPVLLFGEPNRMG